MIYQHKITREIFVAPEGEKSRAHRLTVSSPPFEVWNYNGYCLIEEIGNEYEQTPEDDELRRKAFKL